MSRVIFHLLQERAKCYEKKKESLNSLLACFFPMVKSSDPDLVCG